MSVLAARMGAFVVGQTLIGVNGPLNLSCVKRYFVYIMANHSRTLYVGMTNNLARRVAEHREGLVPGFT